jgi:hypothetical protein
MQPERGNPKALILNALAETLVDSDGRRVEVELQAGLDEKELIALEKQLPGSLPSEIRELLLFARGLKFGSQWNANFTGFESGQFTDFLENSLALVLDGFGNSWNIDIHSNGEWGCVFFLCHDPPVIVVQAPDLCTFLDQIFDVGRAGHFDALTRIYRKQVRSIWRDEPYLVRARQLREEGDPILKDFAAHLEEDYLIADLRKCEIGSGFSWGLSGPDTVVKRLNEELVFAVRKKRTFLQKLMQRQ